MDETRPRHGGRAMTTTIEAPAKLTWSLRITGVRADGYHLIEAEMTSLAIADIVTIEEASTTTISVTGPFAEGVPTGPGNLVARALALAGRTATVRLDKRIPHGGGLGGGSTDAAAILRWAGVDDLVAASRIGADIPFCMRGGRAAVTGIGETVAALPALDRTVTLFVPPLNVSTPAVYARWDAMGGPVGDHGNDLEPAALAEVPELARWRDRIGEATGVRPRLAGSGATWFAEGDHVHAAPRLEGATVILTATRPDAGSVTTRD